MRPGFWTGPAYIMSLCRTKWMRMILPHRMWPCSWASLWSRSSRPSSLQGTGHFVCVVPGDCEIDLKSAAKVSGNKKCDLIHVRELLPLTGYIRGGCSPVGMKKPFPTFFHSTALDYEHIYVSAGVRGLQFRLDPKDIIGYTRAGVADIARKI